VLKCATVSQSSPKPEDKQPKAPQPDTLKSEVEYIRRIVNGAHKRLEKLSKQLAQK
jgi:hypothetical protein